MCLNDRNGSTTTASSGNLQMSDFISWFGNLSASKRVEAINAVLNLCQPLELRFMGSCLTGLLQPHMHILQDTEVKVNTPGVLGSRRSNSYRPPSASSCQSSGSLSFSNCDDGCSDGKKSSEGSSSDSKSQSASPPASPTDSEDRLKGWLVQDDLRAWLILSLALLRPANRHCARELYDLLMLNFQMAVSFVGKSNKGNIRVSQPTDDILLIYMLASHHPAFSFTEKLNIFEKYQLLEEKVKSTNQCTISKDMCSFVQQSNLCCSKIEFFESVNIVQDDNSPSIISASLPEHNVFYIRVIWSNKLVSIIQKRICDFKTLFQMLNKKLPEETNSQQEVSSFISEMNQFSNSTRRSSIVQNFLSPVSTTVACDSDPISTNNSHSISSTVQNAACRVKKRYMSSCCCCCSSGGAGRPALKPRCLHRSQLQTMRRRRRSTTPLISKSASGRTRTDVSDDEDDVYSDISDQLSDLQLEERPCCLSKYKPSLNNSTGIALTPDDPSSSPKQDQKNKTADGPEAGDKGSSSRRRAVTSGSEETDWESGSTAGEEVSESGDSGELLKQPMDHDPRLYQTNLKAWLKLNRMHKYLEPLSSYTHLQLMALTRDQLEASGVFTRGSINKLLVMLGKLVQQPALFERAAELESKMKQRTHYPGYHHHHHHQSRWQQRHSAHHCNREWTENMEDPCCYSDYPSSDEVTCSLPPRHIQQIAPSTTTGPIPVISSSMQLFPSPNDTGYQSESAGDDSTSNPYKMAANLLLTLQAPIPGTPAVLAPLAPHTSFLAPANCSCLHCQTMEQQQSVWGAGGGLPPGLPAGHHFFQQSPIPVMTTPGLYPQNHAMMPPNMYGSPSLIPVLLPSYCPPMPLYPPHPATHPHHPHAPGWSPVDDLDGAATAPRWFQCVPPPPPPPPPPMNSYRQGGRGGNYRMQPMVCYGCHREGHKLADCPTSKSKRTINNGTFYQNNFRKGPSTKA